MVPMVSNRIEPNLPAALLEETRRRMPYLHFRPWIEDARFVDLEPFNDFGARYAAVLATSSTVVGFDGPISGSTRKVSRLQSEQVDWSSVDCLVSLDSTQAACDALARTSGRAIIALDTRCGWTVEEFERMIASSANSRRVQFMDQSDRWPYRLGEPGCGARRFAVVGDADLPEWPSIGLAMPTVDSASEVREAIVSFARAYPGELEFAVVANGSTAESLATLAATAAEFSPIVHLETNDTNLGYGQGSNRGLEYLLSLDRFDFIGVSNDDVLADTDCLCELVCAMTGLRELGAKPGVVGPVSNRVHGRQQVELPPFSSFAEMESNILDYRLDKGSSATQTPQLRGLLMLMDPALLEAIGGFDPLFGIGNFEDDDHNLRTRLAGYSIWIADGAFLYHHGSTTFRRLSVDYEANIMRNAASMVSKWGIDRIDDWVGLTEKPNDVDLKVPLDSWKLRTGRYEVEINGEVVDLIGQATDAEFAAWIVQSLQSSPRTERRRIVEFLGNAA